MRRKFREAKHAAPERVEEILELIRSLYKIEKEAREESLDAVARAALRKEKAPDILSDLKSKIEALQPIAIPKSKLGKAVAYALGQWPTMLRYVDVGEAEIDNNWCEHAIRPLKLGRNNFLFLGNLESGGERAEVFYSLVQSCRRLQINAFDYLKDVIERIARDSDTPMRDLCPRAWQSARTATENASLSTAL